MKRWKLYVCDSTHSGNYLTVPDAAYEQDGNGTRETEAYCSCGRVLHLVGEDDALLLLTAAELHVVDIVAESIKRHRTEPLAMELEESKR